MCSPLPCPGPWQAAGNSIRRGKSWPPYRYEWQYPACIYCTARHSLSGAPSAKCRMFRAVWLHGPGRPSWPYRNISCISFGLPCPSYGVALRSEFPGNKTRALRTRSMASSRGARAAYSHGRRSSAAGWKQVKVDLEGWITSTTSAISVAK